MINAHFLFHYYVNVVFSEPMKTSSKHMQQRQARENPRDKVVITWFVLDLIGWIAHDVGVLTNRSAKYNGSYQTH